MEFEVAGMTELLVLLLVLATAMLAAPCVVTVLVVRYITRRAPSALVVQLEALATVLTQRLQGPQPIQSDRAMPAVPDEILELANRESEGWARDGIVAHARELYGEFDDGRAAPAQIWALVIARLQQETGDELVDVE